MGRDSNKLPRAPSSTPSRCFHPTAGSSSGRRIGTARYREKPTSLSPTGSSTRETRRSSTTGASAEDGEGGGDRLAEGDRDGVADLDRAAVVPSGSVSDSLGEHGKHPARRGLPVRQQGGVRRRARDSAHRHSLLSAPGVGEAAAR